MIAAHKLVRAACALMPPWLVSLFGACLVIPGPFDEAAILLAVLLFVLVQPVRLRRAASAWRGGKSHRRYDTSVSDTRYAWVAF